MYRDQNFQLPNMHPQGQPQHVPSEAAPAHIPNHATYNQEAHARLPFVTPSGYAHATGNGVRDTNGPSLAHALSNLNMQNQRPAKYCPIKGNIPTSHTANIDLAG